jgi:hypothetical protein
MRTGEDEGEGDAGSCHALDIDVVRHDADCIFFCTICVLAYSARFMIPSLCGVDSGWRGDRERKDEEENKKNEGIKGKYFKKGDES